MAKVQLFGIQEVRGQTVSNSRLQTGSEARLAMLTMLTFGRLRHKSHF